jgi:pantoate kinase
MVLSRKFAEHIGLISKRLRAVLEEADSAGLTCSMAMLGESGFTLVKRDLAKEVQEIFAKHASSKRNVVVAEIDFKGARLL